MFGTLQAFLAPEAQHSSPRVADCVAYAVVETPTELLPILFEGVTQGHTVAVQALQILLGGIQRHVPGGAPGTGMLVVIGHMRWSKGPSHAYGGMGMHGYSSIHACERSIYSHKFVWPMGSLPR